MKNKMQTTTFPCIPFVIQQHNTIILKNKAVVSKLILIILFSLGAALTSYSQKINYSTESTPLAQVIEEVENKYDLHFSYSRKLVRDKQVSINAKDIELDIFLETILHPHGITFKETKTGFYVLKSLTKTGYTMHAQISNGSHSLAYAEISIEGSSKGTIADANGNFTLDIDQPEITTLKISYIGHDPTYINAEKFFKTRGKEITLTPKYIELNEVKISEYINPSIVYDEANQLIKLNSKRAQILPGYTEHQLMQSLQIIPGINSNSESASEINFRGSFNDAGLVILNGAPIINTGQMFGVLSRISLGKSSEVEIYKKGITAEYNNAVSGLVLVNSMKEIPKKLSAEAGINFHDWHAEVLSPLFNSNAGINFSIRRSLSDSITSNTFEPLSNQLFNQSNLLEDDLTIEPEAPDIVGHYLNTSMKYIHKIGDKSKLELSAYYNSDDMKVKNNLGNPIENIESNTLSYGGNFEISHSLSSKHKLKFNTNYFNYDGNSYIGLENEHLESETGITNIVNSVSSKLKLESKFGKHNISSGIQASISHSTMERKRNTSLADEFINENTSGSLFIEDIIKWNSKLYTTPSLKLMYYKELNTVKLLPSIKMSYNLFDHFNINFAAQSNCTGYRSWHNLNPEITEISQPITILSGENIPLLRSNEYSLGGWYSNKGLLVEVDFYQKYQSGVLLNGYNNTEIDALQIGDMRISGVEVMLRKRFRHYRTWISYTYSKSYSSFPEISDDEFLSFYDIPHQLQWVHSIHLGQYEFSLGYNYKSGRVYSTPDDFKENPDGTYQLIWTDLNTERLPSYSRIDASLLYKFPRNPYKKWKGTIGVSLINLYNTRNAWYKLYRIMENEEEEIEISSYDRYLLGVSPNVSIKLMF